MLPIFKTTNNRGGGRTFLAKGWGGGRGGGGRGGGAGAAGRPLAGAAAAHQPGVRAATAAKVTGSAVALQGWRPRAPPTHQTPPTHHRYLITRFEASGIKPEQEE